MRVLDLLEKMRVLKKEDYFIKVELIGEDHTIANLIAKYAIKHPSVTYAAYNIEHPLISNPVLIIRTRDKRAVEVFREVLEKILEDISSLEGQLSKLLLE